MKQHITKGQFETLNNEQMLNLMNKLYSKEIKKVKYDGFNVTGIIKYGEGYLPRVSEVIQRINIGKMIEILDSKKALTISKDSDNNSEWWVVDIAIFNKKSFCNYELVDALWEATKEVL